MQNKKTPKHASTFPMNSKKHSSKGKFKMHKTIFNNLIM